MKKKNPTKAEITAGYDRIMAIVKKAKLKPHPHLDAVELIRGHKSGMTDAMFKRMMKQD